MLQADPDFYRAEIRAGVAHWRLGNVEAAAQKFDQVCSISGAPQEAFDRKRELESFVLLKSQVGGRQLPINLQAVWSHGIILVQLIVLSRCLPSKDTYDFQPGTVGRQLNHAYDACIPLEYLPFHIHACLRLLLQTFDAVQSASNAAVVEGCLQQGCEVLLRDAPACQSILSLHAQCLLRLSR